MGETLDPRDDREDVVVAEAARALSAPDDADLSVLSALHQGLTSFPSSAGAGLPMQRPSHGEDGLAVRHHG